jgi:hypothetical protein
MSELAKFRHHTSEGAIDWPALPSVLALFRGSYDRPPVQASPEERLAAAHHLAAHYRRARKPLPNTLAAII